jgi:hypothetical protein
MVAIDGLEFEMIVFLLLNGRFQVDNCHCVEVFEFPQKLEDTFMTDLPNGHLDAAEVEDHLAQQPFLYDGHYLGLRRSVHDHFLEEGECVETDVLLR